MIYVSHYQDTQRKMGFLKSITFDQIIMSHFISNKCEQREKDLENLFF